MRVQIAAVPLSVEAGTDRARVQQNLTRAANAASALKRLHPEIKVIVLPFGAISGCAGKLPGKPEAAGLKSLCEAARLAGVYVAAADAFDTGMIGFIVDPTGAVALTQREIGADTGPAEVAVLDTPVGRVCCLPCDDVTHPEYVRLAMFKGAEIVLNPTVETADHRATARALSRGARSWENHLVLASAGLGAVTSGGARLAVGGSGRAEIRNFTGEMLAEGRAATTSAFVDLTALRQRRADPWVNFPAQLRTGLYASFYAQAAARGPTVHTQTDGPVYDVLLMQAHQTMVTTLEGRDAVIAANMNAVLGMARMFCKRPTTKLVVFPEFFLQGSTQGALDYWEKAGIRIPGPEIDKLCAFATECDVYVSGAVLEYDPAWPRRYFNTAVVISPQGEVILRYRKIQCADLNGLLNVTTPGNVYSEYVARYGLDALIPVVDTPIGKLGAAICYDANWPELWRVMALKGAEVICNPTSEIHSERVPAWYAAKRAHAAEGMFYIASANAGSEQFMAGAPVTGMNRGHSCLIDFHGNLGAVADGPGIVPLMARVDLGALRRARASKAENELAKFRPEAIVDAYQAFPGFPLDCFAQTPMEKGAEGVALVKRQIATLQAAGVFKAA